MDDANLAYVAGLIDGEGCIHLECSRTTYRPRVTVGMTEPAKLLLENLQAEWGGSLYLLRKPTCRWAGAWTWHTGGPEAAELLLAVRPFLRLKRRQADLALQVHQVWQNLAFTSGGKQRRWTPAARNECEQIKQRLHVLNAKGPSARIAEAA